MKVSTITYGLCLTNALEKASTLTSVFGCSACASWAADGTIAHVMLALADDKELRAPFFSSSVECDLGPGHPRIPSEAENSCQFMRERLQISSIHLTFLLI